MKIKILNIIKLTKSMSLTCIFSFFLSVITSAQTNNTAKIVVKSIDPKSIDITP
jgi:hypothetical protein